MVNFDTDPCLLCTNIFNYFHINYFQLPILFLLIRMCKNGRESLNVLCFLAHDRMSVASLCNHDLSVVGIVVVVVVIIVVCEHSS